MNAVTPAARPGTGAADETRVLKLAILALGGQGGGVLTGWIEATALSCGWRVQATSVAGVAQRTGATIYYLEMAKADRAPVFALAPAEGDVDVLVAAELMEAGRAIQRGFVTPDRTTLIASTHRAYATSEKIAPGDGRGDTPTVIAAAEAASKSALLLDLEAVARRSGSVISASLLGALAASGALPFPREAYEAVIRQSGRAAEPSLAAFAAAWDLAGRGEAVVEGAPAPRPQAAPSGPKAALTEWQALTERVAGLPEAAQPMAHAGLAKVVDFQDPDYGGEYLDIVDRFVALDGAAHGWRLTEAAAKYVANAMAYDDVIRVADLKTRADRFARIRDEMGVDETKALALTEYTHPGAEEAIGLLPARLGAWVEARPALVGWIDRRVSHGRRIRSASAPGFLSLWLLAGLRPRRRRLRRHAVETAHRDKWLALALDTAARDVELATEILACRRLIKGYADTRARSGSKFDRTLAAVAMLEGRPDAADWLRRLREAALRDPAGDALDGALKTVASFAEEAA